MEQSALAKLFGILEATAGRPDGRALAEIAAEVRLAKPTAHRILKTLVLLGYMERLDGGVYRQTEQVKRLVNLDGDRKLTRAATPALRELWELTGETVNLGVLRQNAISYLVSIESQQSLRRSVTAGMTDPFACTALGRSIAAHLPPERLDYLLKTVPLEKRTPCTVVEPAEIRRLLHEARESGVAVEVDETDLGVMCFGAAVFDARGVIAAISLSAPSVRGESRRAEFAAAVKSTAERVTRRLRDKGD